MLQVLAQARGLWLNLITKSDLIVRDIDLYQRLAERNRLVLRLTITTADTALARILEPRAPRPDLRFEAVRRLAEAGLQIGVNCSPALPGINDDEASLRRVMAASAQAGTSFFNSELVFLQPCAQAQFFPFLDREFPHLAAAYRRRFAHSAYLGDAERQRHREKITRLCQQYRLSARPEPWTQPRDESQLPLFTSR
jgi:DNA repair photolyase